MLPRRDILRNVIRWNIAKLHHSKTERDKKHFAQNVAKLKAEQKRT